MRTYKFFQIIQNGGYPDQILADAKTLAPLKPRKNSAENTLRFRRVFSGAETTQKTLAKSPLNMY